MKLIVWTQSPSPICLEKAFRRASSCLFFNKKANNNLIAAFYELLKDSFFFLVSGFHELRVNISKNLAGKCIEFDKRVKSEQEKNKCAIRDINFYKIFLDILGTRSILKHNDASLPQVLNSGNPVLLVANHPYPPIDGIMLMNLVRNYRKDFSIIVNSNNSMLSLYPQYSENIIPVHMAEGILRTRDEELVRKSRITSLRKCIERLESGQCVIILPAGQGSKAMAWGQEIKDIDWLLGVGRIVKRFSSNGKPLTILPVYVETHMGGEKNSKIYQKAVIERPKRLCAALQKAFFRPPDFINLYVGKVQYASDFKDVAEENIMRTLRESVYCHAKSLPVALRP